MIEQYEMLRTAALGEGLPLEARSGLAALSPPRHVGVGAGGGHPEHDAPADAISPPISTPVKNTEPSFISSPRWQ